MWTLASCIDRQGKLAARDAAGWVARAAAGVAVLHGREQTHGRLGADAVCVAESSCDQTGYLVASGDLTDEVAYHSPERVRDGKSTAADDVWALGVVFFQCLTGKLPFPGTTRQQVAVSILKRPIATLAKESVDDPALRTLLGALLGRDPDQRVRTVQDLRAKLVEVFPDLVRLRPLGIGEPLEGAPPAAPPAVAARDDADEDEDDDDDGALATALFKDEPGFLQARLQEAQRRALATAAGLPNLEQGREPSAPLPPAQAPAAGPYARGPVPRPPAPAPARVVGAAGVSGPTGGQAVAWPPLPAPPNLTGGQAKLGAVPVAPPHAGQAALGPPRGPALQPGAMGAPRPAGAGAPAFSPPGAPAAAYEIDDAPTVEASSHLRSAAAEAAPVDRDAPVFDPDAVFGPPTALGPPVGPATADWGAIDGLPVVHAPDAAEGDSVAEAVTAPPRGPAPAEPGFDAPPFAPPAHGAPAFEPVAAGAGVHEEPPGVELADLRALRRDASHDARAVDLLREDSSSDAGRAPEPAFGERLFDPPAAESAAHEPVAAAPPVAPAAQAPAPPPAPVPARRAADKAPAAAKGGGGSLLRDALLVLLLTILGGVVGFVFLGKMWAKQAPPPAPSTPPALAPSGQAPAPSTATVTSSEGSGASAAPTAPTAAAASAEPSAATTDASAAGQAAKPPGGDATSCIVSTFATGTFAGAPPDFDFVCTETDAYKGGVALRVKVIRAGGGANGVTEGMREWAMLGWYEMAAFAALRGLCCEGAAPFRTQPGIDSCPIDEKLEALSKAAVSADDAGMEAALKDFAGMLRCLVAAGVSRTFGQPGAPDPGAVTVFRKTLERVRKAAGH